jgi:hypothetical protein
MFVHSVYFWLREDLTDAERGRFVAGLRSLRAIDDVQQGYIGVPAPTDRAVIDRTYSWALVLVFADEQAHDSYQTHPVHDRFRAECGDFYRAVRIYDATTAGEAPDELPPPQR